MRVWEIALEEALEMIRDIPARHVIRDVEFTVSSYNRVHANVGVFYYVDNDWSDVVTAQDAEAGYRARAVLVIQKWYEARRAHDASGC